MKAKKSTVIPICLLVYLAVMSRIGWNSYVNGTFTALYYFGTIIATLAIITVLHFFLKKRERLRQEREDDLRDNKSRP